MSAEGLSGTGWSMVGQDRDPDRLPHLRPLPAIQPGGTFQPGQPVATIALFRDVCAAGLWDTAMAIAPGALRRPSTILEAQPRPVPEAPLAGLVLAEAETLARLAGGRLPDEGEMDRLLATPRSGPFAALPPDLALWTGSAWSAWSYRLVLPTGDGRGWYAHPDRRLPDTGPRAPACLFLPGPPCRRIPASDGQTGGCVIVSDAGETA